MSWGCFIEKGGNPKRLVLWVSPNRIPGPLMGKHLQFAALGREYLEAAHKPVVDGHHGSGIVKLTTVIRGTEDGYQPAPCNLKLGRECERKLSRTNFGYLPAP